MSDEIDNPRVAELRKLLEDGGMSALDHVCSKIRSREHARPLSDEQAARIAEILETKTPTSIFRKGMIVELSIDSVEFRRFGDTFATVVEPRSEHIRVWTHTSKRLRSIKPNRLIITDDVDTRNPYEEIENRPDMVMQARLDNIIAARRSRIGSKGSEKENDEASHCPQG